MDAQLDALVADIVQRCRDGLVVHVGAGDASMAAGNCRAGPRGMTPQHLESLQRLAAGLCEVGRFDDALPVVLQLILHAPASQPFCESTSGLPPQSAPFTWVDAATLNTAPLAPAIRPALAS
jgi:hypothetical protein